MSDREATRSPGHKPINDRDHSPHGRREESPRNHKTKSYSRSPSRGRKMSYRDDRDRERRRDGGGDRDGGRRYSRRRHMGTRDNPKPSRCLGVFGLSVYTTEDELYHIFSKYGPVERVQVVIDAKTGRSRGFSFVYFENTEDAKIAKEQCTGMKINGKSIRVDYSITERAHTPTPGIYMGKPTYISDKWDRRRGGDRDRDDYYGGGGGYRGSKYSHRRSPSPYYRRRRYDRSRSRSYSPRLRTRGIG
ncbi:transformer-2 protein homolog beta isoform X3 [Onthophagus taurus]|uniref:transformer-2 protein homolog beta isoform X3 n=1 Tax=Onthophagus taurus TaxID=166361 RepID=UPI000C2013AB|nr:transformer-2 protein homolog beta isoform X4 [Onthophagus taurus]